MLVFILSVKINTDQNDNEQYPAFALKKPEVNSAEQP